MNASSTRDGILNPHPDLGIDRHIHSFQYRPVVYIILILISSAVYAQSGKDHFTGRVMDAETHQPVSFATVRILSLPDSLTLAGGATDAEGKFQLTVFLPSGKLSLLHISFVGYVPVSHQLPVPQTIHTSILGDILMAPESYALGEAVVVGQAPMAVTEGDTTVFNASAYRTAEGSMLEELVKQLPGGEIDADGKLLINGKEVKKILVDGKEFFSNDPKAALKNLPVEMVERLKAYERKSDLARLTGIEDGEEEMILDLSVKKDMKQGWMGNFMGGLGTTDRYELANTLNRFREKSQLTIIGNLNNTNNQGFSELQKESSNSTGNIRNRMGLTTSRSLGLNSTADWERVKLRSNIQYVGTDRLEDSQTTVDNYLRADQSITKSSARNRTRNNELVANVSFEWKIDSLTTLIVRPQYRTSINDRENEGFQEGWGNGVLLNEKESSSTNRNTQYNLSMMLQVSRKLSCKGRNIALNVDYGTNASATDRTNLSTTRYFKNGTQRVQNQLIEDDIDGYNYRAQFVYVEPLPWNHYLQFRYSYQYRVNNSDRFVYDWDKELEEFAPDYNDEASNRFENQYTNHLLNLSVRTFRKNYNYNIGADFEPQHSASHSLLSDEPTRFLDKSTFNVSPMVNFRYKFSKRTRLQIVYKGKGRQPNIRDLQPVTDRTNPLNIRVGNSSLKPSYTNTFTLNYNSYHTKYQRNMVVSLLAENTINSVTNLMTYDSETGVRTTMPVNMNGNWRALGSFSLNTPFRNRSWVFRTYSYLQYQNQNGYNTQNKEQPIKSSVQHLTVRERLQLTYRTKQLELSARAELLYNNSYNNVVEKRTETFNYLLGPELQFYLPGGMELNSNLVYSLRTGYNYEGKARENLIWNCQLSKAFLKRKQLLIRFKMYDVLHQDISLIRTITSSGIRDTDYNALGSYFMVHTILRLNLMGR